MPENEDRIGSARSMRLIETDQTIFDAKSIIFYSLEVSGYISMV
jgi:hypothetical protein